MNLRFIVKRSPDEYTKLLLHMDDVNLSDSSPEEHSITLNGGVTRSATQYKFGGYSAYFDGTGDYITLPLSSDWDFTTIPFTIDFWVRTSFSAITQTLYMHYPNATNYHQLNIQTDGRIYFLTKNSDINKSFYSTNTVNNGVWHHIALVRSGQSVKLYIDGSEDASMSDYHTTLNTFNSTPFIGYNNPTFTHYMNGYIDEYRISKGIARWTSNFTPPTSPYS